MSEQASIRRHTVALGPYRFLTAVQHKHPSGHWHTQTARRLRKVGPEPIIHHHDVHPSRVIQGLAHHWLKPVNPGHLSWWIGIAFMIGASGFTLGCVALQWPQWLPEALTRPGAVTWTFVIGAIFFTTAAGLQWLQSMFAELENNRYRFRIWRPESLGYWACLIQFIGTLFFNANTADALIAALGPAQQELLIWTPNLLGSICFLVASQLAIMEYAHGWARLAPADISWWIVYLNMLGSALFGISVVGSFILGDGSLLAPETANLTTLGGALCFFVGAYLLIPEAQEKSDG